MGEYHRSRDLAAEENERISFILLQHVYSLATEEAETLVIGRVASDLGLLPEQVVHLVAHLTYAGFLSWEGTSRPIGITDKGIDFIEKLAHRRRSIRVFSREEQQPTGIS
jgi:Mn-dependent DtxR family transcriptional regulator